MGGSGLYDVDGKERPCHEQCAMRVLCVYMSQ